MITGMEDGEGLALLPPSSADKNPRRSWRKSSSCISNVEEQSTGKLHTGTRRINAVSLGFIAYFAIAAGPFGVEDAVGAAGSLPVILAVLILPFTWGLPQALMTAELSTMMSENGGYILWVQRGLGNFAGFVNAFNSIASNLLDLPTYPVLFESYVTAYLRTQGYITTLSERWMTKGVALIFVFISNLFGMRVVAYSSILMSVFVLTPFVLEPFAAIDLDIEAWSQIKKEINWPLFLSTLIWNYQGWDSLGCIAGEVHEGRRTYPIAIGIALLLITINYALPVAVGVAIEPDISLWKEGMLETVANKAAGWIGLWVGAAAIIATLGEFNVVMACSSRALWATSKSGILPPLFSYEWARYRTPVLAIAFQTLTTVILMSFTFTELVTLDTFFNNLTLLLEFASYMRLKYSEPNSHRGFTVPGGKAGAWLITIPKTIVISIVLLTQDSFVWKFASLFNGCVIVLYLVRIQFG